MEERSYDDPVGNQLSVGLGLFSVGLGMAEVLAPRAMARLVGIEQSERTPSIVRAFGAREIGSGVAILMQPHRAAPMWSRVAGDAVDLSYLASAFRAEGSDVRRAAAAMAAVIGVTALDVICAKRLGRASEDGRAFDTRQGVRVAKAVTVNRPIEQVYAFWRHLENLPTFMRHLDSVQTLDAKRSRWKARGPANMAFEWEAEITDERDQERIAWRSLPGSDIESRGAVWFRPAPGARGTELHVDMEYRPPAGSFGRSVGWIFGRNPDQQLTEDLRRFKQLLETGEIPQSDGPGLWRAAQPAARTGRPTVAGARP